MAIAARITYQRRICDDDGEDNKKDDDDVDEGHCNVQCSQNKNDDHHHDYEDIDGDGSSHCL
eukprot:5503653-Karenia_brevis.AAC.1